MTSESVILCAGEDEFHVEIKRLSIFKGTPQFATFTSQFSPKDAMRLSRHKKFSFKAEGEEVMSITGDIRINWSDVGNGSECTIFSEQE